jgi:hypothetical protein
MAGCLGRSASRPRVGPDRAVPRSVGAEGGDRSSSSLEDAGETEDEHGASARSVACVGRPAVSGDDVTDEGEADPP